MIVTHYRGEDLPPHLEGILDWAHKEFFAHMPTTAECWIAGGACSDYFMNRPPKDLDIWFKDKGAFDEICTQFLNLPHLWRLTTEYNSCLKYTGQSQPGQEYKRIDLDLVQSGWFESGEEVLESFDISIAQFAVGREQVSYNEDFFAHLFTGTLAFENLRHPTNTLRRMPKYIQKGFIPPDSQLEKLARAIALLDMDKPEDNWFELARRSAQDGKAPPKYSNVPASVNTSPIVTIANSNNINKIAKKTKISGLKKAVTTALANDGDCYI